ncbi:MAG: PH domain-containing protein [Candidatus Kerfeldbacteria bacterium]|nr:PH domain-containing protein [Candidatus Kerfeldbacteria bacterium]
MPWHNYLSKQLKEGEELVQLVRPYALTLVPPLVGSGLLMVADFFLLAWWFQWRGWGALGFGVVLAIAVWSGLRALYVWSRNVLLITNQRIIDIDQQGFFQRTVAEAAYDKIQDVRYASRGLWQTLFRFGSIVVQTAGTTTNLELSGVKDPVTIQQLITDLQRRAAAERSSGQPSAAELVKTIIEWQQTSPDSSGRAAPTRPMTGRQRSRP